MDCFVDLGIDFKTALDLLKSHNFTFKTRKGKREALRILVEANSILPNTLEHELLWEGRRSNPSKGFANALLIRGVKLNLCDLTSFQRKV